MDGELLAYISPDDPKYDGYRALTPPDGCTILSGPRRYIIHSYNAITEANPGYDYYFPANDDHFCVTEGWDEKLVKLLEEKSNGWGCAMAADKLTDWTKHPHPSGCIISKKTIDTLGYMCYPELHHIGNDVIMGKLFGNLGILHGAHDVLIEHRHWVNGMRAFDDNYRWVYSKEEQGYGDGKVMEYLYRQYETDRRKIQEAMAREAQER